MEIILHFKEEFGGDIETANVTVIINFFRPYFTRGFASNLCSTIEPIRLDGATTEPGFH
jgi:hypothetical protein